MATRTGLLGLDLGRGCHLVTLIYVAKYFLLIQELFLRKRYAGHRSDCVLRLLGSKRGKRRKIGRAEGGDGGI